MKPDIIYTVTERPPFSGLEPFRLSIESVVKNLNTSNKGILVIGPNFTYSEFPALNQAILNPELPRVAIDPSRGISEDDISSGAIHMLKSSFLDCDPKYGEPSSINIPAYDYSHSPKLIQTQLSDEGNICLSVRPRVLLSKEEANFIHGSITNLAQQYTSELITEPIIDVLPTDIPQPFGFIKDSFGAFSYIERNKLNTFANSLLQALHRLSGKLLISTAIHNRVGHLCPSNIEGIFEQLGARISKALLQERHVAHYLIQHQNTERRRH